MQESTCIPKGKLSRYVKFLWCNESYTPESTWERVLPTGSPQLIINLEDKKFRHLSGNRFHERLYSPAVVAGIQTGHIFLDSYTRISTVGVVLKPSAMSALFRIPPDEFKDQVVSLNDVLEIDTSALRERLIMATTHKEKFCLMETFLTNLLDSQHQLHAAVDFAIKKIDSQHGTMAISKILDKTGYSRRWFSKIFRDTVGISPKQYSRIQRFQHLLKQIRKINEPDWSELTFSNGYFDQAHLIHDFKNLAGISPSQYFRNQSKTANHLAV